MEQMTQNWEAAVMAAGMAAVYNADDWDAIVDNPGTTLHPYPAN